MSKIRQLAPLLFLLVSACVPKAFLLEQPKLVSVYFERKIDKLEKTKSPDLDSQRLLMRTKVEYGFGIIMEQANVAVVGATGAVGEVMLEMLEERQFPIKKIYPLASERSAGTAIRFNGRSTRVESLADFDFGQDVIL